MGEGEGALGRVEEGLPADVGNPRRGPQVAVGIARAHDAGPGRRAGPVAAADHDRRAGAQARLGGRPRGDSTDHRGRGACRRQQPEVQIDGVSDLAGPSPPCEVEQVGARGVRVVGGELARQAVGDVVLGLQEMRGPAPHLRLVGAQPEGLGRRVGRAGPVPGDGIDPLSSDAFGKPAGFLLGARVSPDQGGPQRRAGGIQRQAGHHLAGKADYGDVLGGVPRGAQKPRGGPAQRGPPVLGVLLGPSRAGVGGGVGRHLAGQRVAVRGKERGLVAGGAEVKGQDERCHGASSFS